MKADTDSAVSIRLFRAADYDAVFRLWKRSEGVGLSESDRREGVVAYLRRNPGLSFVATKGGRIVGAVLCGHDGRRGYLQHLAVAKRYRGRGIGRRLVEACLAKLRAAGFLKCNIFVFSTNVEGLQFWRRRGWKSRPDLRLMQVMLREPSGS